VSECPAQGAAEKGGSARGARAARARRGGQRLVPRRGGPPGRLLVLLLRDQAGGDAAGENRSGLPAGFRGGPGRQRPVSLETPMDEKEWKT